MILSYEDRRLIKKLFDSGMSTTNMAKTIGCHINTIYRELERGKVVFPGKRWPEYDPDKAEAYFNEYRKKQLENFHWMKNRMKQ